MVLQISDNNQPPFTHVGPARRGIIPQCPLVTIYISYPPGLHKVKRRVRDTSYAYSTAYGRSTKVSMCDCITNAVYLMIFLVSGDSLYI